MRRAKRVPKTVPSALLGHARIREQKRAFWIRTLVGCWLAWPDCAPDGDIRCIFVYREIGGQTPINLNSLPIQPRPCSTSQPLQASAT